MTRIAHLSDLHLLERTLHQRSAPARMRLSFLSFGRSLDVEGRIQRVARALGAFKLSKAEHLVITGDLTEDGTDAQFEVLAEVLSESKIDPERITLTAGNHDAYEDPRAFERALQGPLKPFATTSREGRFTVLGDITIVPISTVMAQHYTRSAGQISTEGLSWAAGVVKRLKSSRRITVLAQHHAPIARSMAAYNWIDGLQNHQAALELLGEHANVHVLHGHEHRRLDRPARADDPPRVFGTAAVVDTPDPLRIYEACDDRLWPVASLPPPESTRHAHERSFTATTMA
jgi:Icc protein